ncbi:MAG TPA: cytochrome c [Anaerolineales bacterium]|nr:cytochrome c [Anaerolineales bacterium]HRF48821.1 cytochrome c [Anaerolineales bacterium]
MSAPTSAPAWRRCWPLTIVTTVFATCFLIPLCLFGVLQLNAGYWYLLRSAAGPGVQPAQAQSLPEDSAGATVFSTSGCKGCHTLTTSSSPVGPSLAGLGARAGGTVPGLSAEDYVRESILEPDDYVVPGYPDHVMPADLGARLSEAELDALIAFLLSQ